MTNRSCKLCYSESSSNSKEVCTLRLEDPGMSDRDLFFAQRLRIYRQVESNLQLQIHQFLLAYLRLSLLGLESVDLIWFREEVWLTCRHDQSLPLRVIALQAASSLAQDHVERHHDKLRSDLARYKIRMSMHRRMDWDVGSCVTYVRVLAVRWHGFHDTSRVKILDRELGLMVSLCILG